MRIYLCVYIYNKYIFTNNVNIFTKNAIYIYRHIYFAMLCSHIHAYTFYAVVLHSVVSDSLRPHGLYTTGLPGPRSLYARLLEWVPVPFSSRSCQPRDQIRSTILHTNSLLTEPPGKPLSPKQLSGFKNTDFD